MPVALPPDLDDIYRHLDDLRRWFDAIIDPDTDADISPEHHGLLRSLRDLAEDAEYRATRRAMHQEQDAEKTGSSAEGYHAFREKARQDAQQRAEASLGPHASPSDVAALASDLEHDILLSSPKPPANA